MLFKSVDHALTVLFEASLMKCGNYCVFHVRYLVTKTVTYFPLQCARNSGPVMAAVLAALHKHGFQTVPNNRDADIAVIWSVLWSGRMQPNKEIYELYRRTGRPVVCIDIGALLRGTTWKIALNNINALGHYGHKTNLDFDRPQKLGIKLSKNSLNHGRILIAGQHTQSLQLDGIDQTAWYLQRIQEVADGRQIVVRPHPRCALDQSRFPKHVIWEQPKKLVNTYDSFDLHWDFDAVINYNSGPGIQAVIAGVPVIVDQSSLAFGITDRHQWLAEICHTEYTVEEIEQGTWVKRIGLEH
jgi:hypothetical protein